MKDEFNEARDSENLRSPRVVMIINVCTTNIVKIADAIMNTAKPSIVRYLKYG